MFEPQVSPVGVSVATNQELNRIEHVQAEGALRLLLKAAAAWEASDETKAARLLDRVAARPFDRRAGLWPGPFAAHMLLFELLTHVVEDAEEDDELEAWCDGVEAALTASDDALRSAILDALVPVHQDWNLPDFLARRVQGLLQGHGRDDGRWFEDGLGATELRAGTEATLRAATLVAREFEARGLCSHLRPDYW